MTFLRAACFIFLKYNKLKIIKLIKLIKISEAIRIKRMFNT